MGSVIVLDWRRDARVSPVLRPCTVCGEPTLLISPAGPPCHKGCAEARITAYLTARPADAPARLGAVLAVLGAEHWHKTATAHGLPPEPA